MKNLLAIIFIISFLCNCQEEFERIDVPGKNETINSEDNLAALIHRMSLKDGSFDNFIDECSTISIKFPYTIKLRGEMIAINAMKDIEKVSREYTHMRNAIIINFPVTIIFNDYSESILSNRGKLQAIQNQCNTGVVTNINCIDFIYPIELNLYNTAFQTADFIIAKNDKDIYNVFNDLENLLVEINYPLLLKTPIGDTLSVNDNFDLENKINIVIEKCKN